MPTVYLKFQGGDFSCLMHILQYVYGRGIAAKCLHILQYVYGRRMEQGRGLTGHITILCLKKKVRYSKMLRRLRIMDVLESYHFQNDLQKGSSPLGNKVSFASPLQSRHPSSYPHLWPNSSPTPIW